MMPKRVAETSPNEQISDYTGTGPFVFKKDEWKPGDKAVYVKFDKYKPRAEPPSGLAGGKVVKVDRVEWQVVADQQTAINALIAGEIDYIEQPPHDLLPLLKADTNVKLVDFNPLGNQYAFRFNTTAKPFDNPKIRQARALRAQPGGLPEGDDRRPAVLQGVQGDVRLRHAAGVDQGHGRIAASRTSPSRRRC